MNRLTRAHALAFMVLCLLVAAFLRLPDLPSLPPGLHYDEAANAILSAEIGRGDSFPLFISSYTGKEALFFYLAGGLMALIGESVFALRLAAAFVGMLTVASIYWLGKEMLADRRVAILAAALLAVSFWHVLFSRLGFRAITEPLFQALAIAALFRGMRRDQRLWFVVGGVFLGLTAYTYLAARLFPLLIAVAAIPLLLMPLRRKRIGQLALYGAVALVVLLPLLGYFFTHPDAFWVRITQVAPSADNLTLTESFGRAFGMFFLRGDPFWRFNLPGKPLFNWFWGGLLVVGWLIAAWRYRRFPYDWQKSAILLLLAAPLIMILPTALATGEIVPSNLRAIGMIPFLFYLPAVGAVILLHDLQRRFGAPPVTAAVLFLGLLVLLSGGLATYQAYFEEWGQEPTLFFEADGDLTAVADFLDQADLDGEAIFVAAPHYKHPTVAFLSERYGEIKWLPNSEALVYPANGDALVVFPHNSPAPEWAEPLLDLGRDLDLTTEQARAFRAMALTDLPPLPLDTELNANFGRTITLLGYRLAPVVDGMLPLTLVWRVEQTPSASFAPFVHLEDEAGTRWSQNETFAYPAEQWQPGEIIVQQVEVDVPAGTPPGAYRLRVGLYDAASDTTLARLDERGSYAGNAAFIENVSLPSGGVPEVLPTPPNRIGERMVPGLWLVGYGRGDTSAETGESYGLTLWWHATQTPPNLTSRFELIRPDQTGRILLNTQPVRDSYPFQSWETPLFLIDPQTLTIPDDLESGAYRLQYRLLDANDGTLFTTDLGPLQITATERLFDPPAMAERVDASFGNEIALLGYTVTERDDNSAEIKLIWQALEPPSADYTVFFHVLNADGSCCAWQTDAMPQQGGYPTGRWVTDEIVVDRYEIPTLPAGSYPLEIGLYVAETGQRLQVVRADTPTADAVYLAPLVIEEE